MAEIKTKPLFTLSLNVEAPLTALGDTPHGGRVIARVRGGTFEGDRLSGTVHDGGGDWLLMRADGVMTLDVRITLETTDGALIYMTYRGMRHGPADVMERLAKGEPVDPDAYYFRVAPSFETSDERYTWLNKMLAVATGHRLPTGPVYEVFEVC
jgi:hypothetical protein